MILINPYYNNGETLKPTYKKSGQIITTSAEVTLNGRALGIILVCPEKWWLVGLPGDLSLQFFPPEHQA